MSRMVDWMSAISLATRDASQPESNVTASAATRLTDVLGELLKAAPVREGPAGLKGRGVFATRAMRRGEVCTAYPCDMLKVTDEGGAWLMGLSVGEGDAVRLARYAQFLQRNVPLLGQLERECGIPNFAKLVWTIHIAMHRRPAEPPGTALPASLLRHAVAPVGQVAGARPFVKLRELALAAAEAGRLRKWRPVPGCPCDASHTRWARASATS